MARERFDHKLIEKSTQERWASERIYETDLSNANDAYYLLFEFPYPSGDLHIGHWYAYAMPDIYARLLRMQGKNVLFPIGFDAFGLPAENAAIKRGADPKEWTLANIDKMREQLKSMGTSVDWSKEIITCDPSYYRWTQWLFAKLNEKGLAYRASASVKWCPKDQTVLANEQVIDGKCERCDSEVEEKKLTQWFMKITDYAEKLLTDLDPLPWREDIKDAQRAWIGKSEGARLWFPLAGRSEKIEVFTTRPDTVYGATYVVLAPEHSLVDELLSSITNVKEVEAYRENAKRKTERERSENKEKTGVLLEGVSAVNPGTNEEIPVYLADYVLASYGTGAVMAVPAHDERDYAFAQKHALPVRHVLIPQVTDLENPPQEGKENTFRKTVLAIVRNKDGKYLILRWKKQPWSTFITGGIEDGETAEVAALREIKEETGYQNVKLVRTLGGLTEGSFYAAHKGINRKIHGTSLLFELVDDTRVEVSEEERDAYDIAWLSEAEVEKEGLRHGEFGLLWQRVKTGVDVYTGHGILTESDTFNGRLSEEAKWDIVNAIGGERMTNYRIRDWLVSRQRYWGCPIPMVYDPEGKAHYVGDENLPWLLPSDVDFTPTGKAPLASSKELHERVERIFGKGWTPEYDTLDTFVDSSWYFYRYLAHTSEKTFSDESLLETWIPVDRYSGGSEHTTMHLLYARFFHKALQDLGLVPGDEPFVERFNRGIILGSDGQKMSKRWGNVINPDEMVERYGADAVRMYLAFIGPFNEAGHYPWNLDGVESMRRFLDRVYALRERVASEAETNETLIRDIAKATVKVGSDADRFKFNTAISAIMVLMNTLEAQEVVTRTSYRSLLILLAPFAPHLAEHLWENLKEDGSVHQAPWPTYDASLLQDTQVTVIVQVNGKRKGEIRMSPDADEMTAREAAGELPGVAEALSGAARIVYVPGRILNIVPSGP